MLSLDLLVRQNCCLEADVLTPDGAPAMIGCTACFIALSIESESLPNLLSCRCIIHQQVLCRKILNIEDMTKIEIRIVCSIRTKSLLRSFSVEENDDEHSDLPLHTDVRWLSRGTFSARFMELLPKIMDFLKLSKRVNFHKKLEDHQQLLDLSLLTGELNGLNLELQGEDKNVTNIMSSVNTFKSKLQRMSSSLQRGNLHDFPRMPAELQVTV